MMEPVSDFQSKPAPRALPRWVILISFALLLGFLLLIFGSLLSSIRAQNPVKVGQIAPAFKLSTFDGNTVDTVALRGKIIVVNFWASWCKPCEQEAAELEETWKKYQSTNKVTFIGVAYVDTEPEARKYLQRFNITYPNGPDLRSEITRQFRVKGVPETYIIDGNGVLAYRKIGPFSSIDELTTIIDQLLAE